jgi:hypothetical protein
MQGREPSLELHIEELVLEGLGRIDGAQISAVVRQELARLLAEHGTPPAFANGNIVAHLDGGSFVAGPNTDIASLGSQIAQAVYRGIEHG